MVTGAALSGPNGQGAPVPTLPWLMPAGFRPPSSAAAGASVSRCTSASDELSGSPMKRPLASDHGRSGQTYCPCRLGSHSRSARVTMSSANALSSLHIVLLNVLEGQYRDILADRGTHTSRLNLKICQFKAFDRFFYCTLHLYTASSSCLFALTRAGVSRLARSP